MSVIEKAILGIKRNMYKPDLHSFMIDLRNGDRAYVAAQIDGIRIVTTSGIDWVGLPVSAANLLDSLGADPETIDM